MNAADYKIQLERLLPLGKAYEKAPGSALLELLLGMAEELARLHARGEQLLLESDPTTATETFDEWLTMAGIPDPCSLYAISTGDERAQLLQKLTALTVQTAEFYIQVAEILGYPEVSVQEFFPFTAGSNAGEPLYGDAWRHAFSVVINEPRQYLYLPNFYAGSYLTTAETDLLACIMEKAKPAHTVAFIGYQEGTE